MAASRIVLFLTWLAACLFVFLVTRFTQRRRNLWLVGLVVLITILACLFDWWAPRPLRATKITPPFITLRINPNAFPVSVPSHSVLSILPLHPYQTFTAAANHLHEFDNSCGEEHFWPTQDEINSKPANGYEEVRRIEVTNHSRDTMESGRLVFRVLYNDSFGGGCMPPPAATLPQDDVVSVPALDQGKTFEFVAVNQTNRCAWLLAPTTIKARMASDENATEAPLRLEQSNVPNWVSSPFPATTIKWEGVPTKNPGYGIVRSGAPCQSPNDDRKRVREIQRRLAHLMNEGIVIRTKWVQVMGQPEDTQRADSGEVPYWHAKIEKFIRTLPRSDVYLARLNSAHRSDFGYPVGINQRVAGNWDLLLVDLSSLKEFMDDPDFGRP